MASGRITIDVGLEASGVAKGAKDAEKALENLEDAVGDAAKEGKQLDKIEDELKDVQKQSDKTGRAVGTDLDKGFDKAKAGADDFKQEAGSTMRETAASISSVEDGLGAVQEIAANAFVGFGPVGAGAGLVTALGFGLLLENLNKQNEAIAAQKQYYADAYQAAAEEGRKYLDVQTILREANDIQFSPDRVDEYNRALQQSETLGLNINDVLLARAGDEEALQVVMEATKQKQDELKKSAEDSVVGLRQTNSKQVTDLQSIQSEYEKIGEVNEENVEKAKNSQSIKDQLSQQERDQIARTAAADQARYEALAAHIRGIPKPEEVEVKLKVDDSEVRNYRPPIISIKGRIQMPAGTGRYIE